VLRVRRIPVHVHWCAVLHMHGTVMQAAAVHVHAGCRYVHATALQVAAVYVRAVCRCVHLIAL
jgi:hypothetical protein